MNYMRKFRKNAKALSPVIASIILIAVTVAVSVVVAAWMGGMSLGLMGNAEQATITNVVLNNVDASTGQAYVTIRNTGSATVSITSQTIDGNTATITFIDGIAPTGTTASITKGNTVNINMTASVQFNDGAQYVIKLITAKGNTLTYTATYNAA